MTKIRSTEMVRECPTNFEEVDEVYIPGPNLEPAFFPE